MKRRLLKYLLVFILLSSCKIIGKEQTENHNSTKLNTAVLTNRTCALIDLFLDNTKQWRKGNEQLSLTGWMDEKKEGYFYLNICADDTTFCKPSGDCKGVVHVKGNSILLFGDSWNDYFWSSDTTYHVPYMKRSAEDEFIFYDPAEWTICIRKDTSLCEAYSALPCDISLLDSIEKILRQQYKDLDK